jgi:hypothetical protein
MALAFKEPACVAAPVQVLFLCSRARAHSSSRPARVCHVEDCDPESAPRELAGGLEEVVVQDLNPGKAACLLGAREVDARSHRVAGEPERPEERRGVDADLGLGLPPDEDP